MSEVKVRGQPQLQLTLTQHHVHWDVRVVETWLLYQLNFSAFWSDMMPDHNVFYCWFCGVYTAVPGHVPVLEFVQMCHLGRGSKTEVWEQDLLMWWSPVVHGDSIVVISGLLPLALISLLPWRWPWQHDLSAKLVVLTGFVWIIRDISVCGMSCMIVARFWVTLLW